MNVTLDIFSGLPNPSWTLSADDASELVSRLAGKTLPAAEAVSECLGFRGYIISASTDDDETAAKAGLPETFRVAAGTLESFIQPPEQELPALASDEAADASQWLLTTAGGHVDDELLDFVKEAISGGGQPSDEAVTAAAAAACVIKSTAYNPSFWNAPSVQPYNNCYNYAMNCRSDTFAQPGRISGHPNSVMQCANVAKAADRDGCKATCSGPNKKVALVIWPGRDYHWYRLHSNGFWGHKPGGTAARNTDNRGRVIGGSLNPQNCDRGPYTQFCGYRFSPVGMKVR